MLKNIFRTFEDAVLEYLGTLNLRPQIRHVSKETVFCKPKYEQFRDNLTPEAEQASQARLEEDNLFLIKMCRQVSCVLINKSSHVAVIKPDNRDSSI